MFRSLHRDHSLTSAHFPTREEARTPATKICGSFWPRMSRLIDTECAAARKRQLGQQSPALIFDRAARNVHRLHLSDERIDVVRHQIQLVTIVVVGGMDGDF